MFPLRLDDDDGRYFVLHGYVGDGPGRGVRMEVKNERGGVVL